MSRQQATLPPGELSCPICPFTDDDEHTLALHIENVHFGGGVGDNAAIRPSSLDASAFASDESILEDRISYVVCTFEGCGEEILKVNLQEHLDFHIAERLSLEEEAAKFNAVDSRQWTSCEDPQDSGVDLILEDARDRSTSAEELDVRRWANLDENTRRLRVKDLGPHAFEIKMPEHIRKLIAKENETKISTIGTNGQLNKGVQQHVNRTKDMVLLLGCLLEADTHVKEAWLCSDAVQWIYKLKGEGSFCGYRNMQMMLSYVAATDDGLKLPSPDGHICGNTHCCKDFIDVDAANGIPDILHLQDLIESAWDHGFNPGGRVETGGIVGTRKYVGTPEAYALFEFLRLRPWSAEISQNDKKHDDKVGDKKQTAYVKLLDKIETYFTGPSSAAGQQYTSQPFQKPTFHHSNDRAKLHYTDLPSIYLQAPGHSVTVVGLEVLNDGSRNLLVFDPSYGPGKDVSKLLTLASKLSTSTKKQPVSTTSSRDVQSKQAYLRTTNAALSPSTSKYFTKHDAKETAPTFGIGQSSIDTSTSNLSSHKRKRADSESSKYVALSSQPRQKPAQEKVTDTLTSEEASKLLLPFRRGAKHLSRNNTFELLMLRQL